MAKNCALLLGITLLGILAVLLTRNSQAQNPEFADNDSYRIAERPVQVQTTIIMPAAGTGFRKTLLTVPNHQELVVEYLSCVFEVPSGQWLGVSLPTSAGGGTASFLFSGTKQGVVPPTSNDEPVYSQQTRIFGDPGTKVDLEIERSSNVGEAQGGCSIAGQLKRRP